MSIKEIEEIIAKLLHDYKIPVKENDTSADRYNKALMSAVEYLTQMLVWKQGDKRLRGE